MSENDETQDADPAKSGKAIDGKDPHAGEAFVPPTDGSWIPRSRFDQILGKVGALEARLADATK